MQAPQFDLNLFFLSGQNLLSSSERATPPPSAVLTAVSEISARNLKRRNEEDQSGIPLKKRKITKGESQNGNIPSLALDRGFNSFAPGLETHSLATLPRSFAKEDSFQFNYAFNDRFTQKIKKLIKLNLPLEEVEIKQLLIEVNELKKTLKAENSQFPVVIEKKVGGELLRIEAYAPNEIILVFPQSKEKEKFIGRGGCKFVYHAWNLSNPQHLAYFKIKLQTEKGKYPEIIANHIQKELNILDILRENPSFPKIYKSASFLDENNQLYQVLIQEFFPIDLWKIIHHNIKTEENQPGPFFSILSDKEKLSFAWQLTDALDFLHEKQIIHRDIKPENILIRIDKNKGCFSPIICDFDLAVSSTDLKKIACMTGTIEYRAIESLKGEIKADQPQYALALDYWSLGCVLYMLFSDKVTPWLTATRGKTEIESKEIVIEHYEKFHKEGPYEETPLKHMIWKMLHLDPLQRPPLNEVKKFIEEEWDKLGKKKSRTFLQQFE